jgi:hypothetical protein
MIKINGKNNSYHALPARSLGKRENLQKLQSQPFGGETLEANICCPCNSCILDICFILVVTVILVLVFYFEIHTYIMEFEVDYWKLQWRW